MYNAFITGASSGIGQAIYQQLKARNSWKVFGLSRRGPDFKYNLSYPINEQPLISSVDLLVNCAGIMPFDESKYVFDINFWGTYNIIQNLLPAMKRGSCIINVASVSGINPDEDLPIYAASKAAVISLTKSLAKKYAPDIRVNCISPGFYETNLVPGEIPKELIDKIPMGRAEQPYFIMPVIDMIWTSRYMTGSNIVIDGGVSL
jgi:NAD(P)-dependent dehydrogenase (short-subunit alcohol dehydrogenase family)